MTNDYGFRFNDDYHTPKKFIKIIGENSESYKIIDPSSYVTKVISPESEIKRIVMAKELNGFLKFQIDENRRRREKERQRLISEELREENKLRRERLGLGWPNIKENKLQIREESPLELILRKNQLPFDSPYSNNYYLGRFESELNRLRNELVEENIRFNNVLDEIKNLTGTIVKKQTRKKILVLNNYLKKRRKYYTEYTPIKPQGKQIRIYHRHDKSYLENYGNWSMNSSHMNVQNIISRNEILHSTEFKLPSVKIRSNKELKPRVVLDDYEKKSRYEKLDYILNSFLSEGRMNNKETNHLEKVANLTLNNSS